MNVYMLGAVRGKLIDVTNLNTVMVHGSDNYNKAETMFNEGKSIDEIRKYFCQKCGNFMGKDGCNCEASRE